MSAAPWPPKCDACGATSTEPGRILLGVPSPVRMVPKWHLCAECLHALMRVLRMLKDAPEPDREEER